MVSTNMLQRVMMRTSAYNNELAVAKSWLKSLIKMAYYYCVAAVYGAAGGFANVSFTCLTDSDALGFLARDPGSAI